ncbi:MAG: hypothetical protein ACOVRN_18910 [Flavobacterium sp.]
MDDSQRLQLQNMIKVNNVEDQTGVIRQLKHSQLIRNDVNRMILIKAAHRGDDAKIQEECLNECGFLFTYYTDIYNKVRKDEISINILNKFLDVLKRIEEGEMDQHEGSFMVGTLLKELYVDSALKKAEKLNEQEQQKAEAKEETRSADVNVSYKQYKKMYTLKMFDQL